MQFPSSNAGQGALFGISAASSLIAGLGQRAEGKQEQAADNYNADITEQNTADEIVANSQAYAQLVGRQAVAYASAGVDITRGSPLLMMAATAGRGAVRGEQLYEAGDEQATLQRYYGKLSAFRGKMSGIGTFLNGVSRGATTYLSNTGYIPPSNVPSNVDFTAAGG